jgi:hypothetical protein
MDLQFSKTNLHIHNFESWGLGLAFGKICTYPTRSQTQTFVQNVNVLSLNHEFHKLLKCNKTCSSNLFGWHGGIRTCHTCISGTAPCHFSQVATHMQSKNQLPCSIQCHSVQPLSLCILDCRQGMMSNWTVDL